jgi:hypothetical protein
MAGYTLWRLIGLCLFGAFISNVLPVQTANAATLNLTCYGEANIRHPGNPAANRTDHDYVEVRLSGDDARIRLPQGFRPSTSDNGWYKIKYLKASEGDIIGNAIISFIDKPFFRVERLSGRIDVSGLGGTFSGECRKTDQ